MCLVVSMVSTQGLEVNIRRWRDEWTRRGFGLTQEMPMTSDPSVRGWVASFDKAPQSADVVVAYRPDVALVDIGLPEIDGNEVARRIRALLGAGGIFLVALTGYGGEAEEELARAAGFDAHFTKPVELSRLDRLLRTRCRAGQEAP